MIPKLSAPLTKLIRTLEGVIWLGANVALIVAPIVSSHVSPADSIKYATILNAVAFASRQALKGLALAKGAGLPAPRQWVSGGTLSKIEAGVGTVAGDIASDVSQGTTVEEVLAQIAAAEGAAAAIQAKPGTPSGRVSAGLAPSTTVGSTTPAPVKPPIDVPAQ